jgi:hypothetical protein
MPVFAEKTGSKKPKRPDCSVDVVEATTIARSRAKGVPCPANRRTATSASNRYFMSIFRSGVDLASTMASRSPPDHARKAAVERAAAADG